MKQSNYIVCPKCHNDKSFECFGDRVDYGISAYEYGAANATGFLTNYMRKLVISPTYARKMSSTMSVHCTTCNRKNKTNQVKVATWMQNNS